MNCTKDLVSRKCSTSIVRGRVSRAKESLRERESDSETRIFSEDLEEMNYRAVVKKKFHLPIRWH